MKWMKFGNPKPKVLIFIHLIQDLDLVLPLLLRLNKRNDLTPQVCILDKVLDQSPRVKTTLTTLKVKYSKVSKLGILAGLEPNLMGIKGLITAAESTVNPHKAAYFLTQRANQLGIFTYTLQHGFENIGLNYSDEVHSIDSIHFASQKILIWGDVAMLSKNIHIETKSRCISVGCPKEVSPISAKIELPGRRKYLIAVFENLHWHRYNEDYRQYFLNDIEKMAIKFPETTFLLKPHHAGKWLTDRYKGNLPYADNIIIADPNNPVWEPFTAPAIINDADAVVTTPSTVAIDAARVGCPVSIVGYGLDLANYCPLPIINNTEDWISFIEQIQNQEGRITAKQQVQEFVDKNIMSGDAIQRILDLITVDISKIFKHSEHEK
jgi:hypothetical protein